MNYKVLGDEILVQYDPPPLPPPIHRHGSNASSPARSYDENGGLPGATVKVEGTGVAVQ